MAHTNHTTHYNLPQFLTGDKPAWLTDVNNAYADIDTAIYNAQSDADAAQGDATQAIGDAGAALTAAAAADAKGSGAVASIESNFDPTTVYNVGQKVMYNSLLYVCTVAIVTPGPWTGSANWARITVDEQIATTNGAVSAANARIDAISATESDYIPIPTYGGAVNCYKRNNVVTIVLNSFGTVRAPEAGRGYTIASIPAKYRPQNNIWLTGTRVPGYKYDSLQGYQITSAGEISTYVYGGSEITNGNFCISYIV